jgi:hypothetical protein
VRAIAADGCTGVRRLSPHVACMAMLVLLALIAPSASSAATLQATPSNLSSVFSSAAAGDTIQLSSGSYSFSGGTKSGMVTLTPASGASVTMSANFAPAAFITLQNMTVSNLGVSGKSHDIKILNNTFTGQANLNMTGNANANILVDGNSFDGISVCGDCAEGRLEIGQYPSGTAPVGVTISHNHFGGGGQSDGVQDGAYGVIIDSNEFDGVQQLSGYTRHIDSIQLYGASHTQITNNYLHNFTTAIMAPDGGDHEIINNNVFINPSNGGSAIQLGHHNGTTFIHNVVKGTDVFSFVGSGDSNPNKGFIAKDNVMVNAAFQMSGCVSCTNANNLYNSSGSSSGTNAVVGTPAFSGGSAPSTFGGWGLTSSSPGAGKADDGSNIGIDPSGNTSIGGGGTTTPPADTTAPDTTIGSGPSGTITTNTGSFAFTSSESGSTFQCQLDSGSWTTCTSPKAYSSLADGSHTFSVKAIDAAGNYDASPATRTFTVNTAPPADTTAPDTTIGSGPSGTITTTSGSFAFTSSESGSTFQCQLDGSAWASCTSPKAYSSLGAGSHTFGVKATDAAGNTDASPATRTFTVNIPDTTAPATSITSGPTGTTSDATPTFAFTSSESGSTFQCRVESTGTWTACTSPYTLGKLADGSHSFAVRATDGAGNTDASAAAQTFTVDTTAPKTTITAAPTTLTIGSAATVEFKADDAAATFRCSLDGGAFAACTSPDTIDGLGLGSHTLTVRATDAAGNAEPTGASATWSTVALPTPPVTDPTPPTSTTPPVSTDPPTSTTPPVTTDPAPSNAPAIALTRPTTGSTFTSSLSAAAKVTDSEGVQRVEFWLDGTRMSSDKYAPYSTLYNVPRSVAYGAHTLTVRAFDRKGNASSVAISVTKVRSGARTASAASGFRVGSAAIGSATTALSGYTTAGHTQTITYTRCSDSRGKALGTRKVKADGDGNVLGTLPVADACVLKVS